MNEIMHDQGVNMPKDDSLARGRRRQDDFAAERAAGVPGFVPFEHRAGFRTWIAAHDREVVQRAAERSASIEDLFADAAREGTVEAWQHLATYLSLRLEQEK